MKFSTTQIPLLWLLLAAASPAVGGSALTIEPTRFKSESGQEVAAETGSLVVAENRHVQSGRTITLKFVRFRSTSNHPGSPIIYLAGGPGGSGIDAAKGARFPLFMAMREFGDVIALDQRGTGASEPSTRCTEPYMLPFTKPLDRAEAEGILAAGMKQCLDRLAGLGIDATAYNTLASADDIDDLRKALGAEKVSLWGISYGTHLGLATLRAHGDHIDRAIFAGIEPLANTFKLPSDQQALLQKISSLARKDRALVRTLPDLTEAIARILDRLRKEPATVTLVHPANGKSIPVKLGAFDLQLVLASMLTGPEEFAGMPDFIARLDHGDWTALALLAARFRMGKLPSAMSVAMDCASGVSSERTARIASEAAETLLGDAINFPVPGICTGLGIPDLGDAYRQPVRSDVPVLLISGTLDGRTPLHNADEVTKDLANAQRLVIDGAGHSDPLFLSSPKILDAMKTFMRGKKLRSENITAKPVPFLVPRTVVAVPEKILERYVGTYQLDGKETRKVVKAGSLIFTIRGNGSPNPLRPLSETDFFWEGGPERARFDVSAEGVVTAMETDADGSGRKWQRAKKID
ncbi:MAG: alpha/beta fold hydrolase [Dokdonella sp.]